MKFSWKLSCGFLRLLTFNFRHSTSRALSRYVYSIPVTNFNIQSIEAYSKVLWATNLNFFWKLFIGILCNSCAWQDRAMFLKLINNFTMSCRINLRHHHYKSIYLLRYNYIGNVVLGGIAAAKKARLKSKGSNSSLPGKGGRSSLTGHEDYMLYKSEVSFNVCK